MLSTGMTPLTLYDYEVPWVSDVNSLYYAHPSIVRDESQRRAALMLICRPV